MVCSNRRCYWFSVETLACADEVPQGKRSAVFTRLYVLGVLLVEVKEFLALRVRQVRIHWAGRVDPKLCCVHSAALLYDQGKCTVQVILGLEPVKSDGPWGTAVI